MGLCVPELSATEKGEASLCSPRWFRILSHLYCGVRPCRYVGPEDLAFFRSKVESEPEGAKKWDHMMDLAYEVRLGNRTEQRGLFCVGKE